MSYLVFESQTDAAIAVSIIDAQFLQLVEQRRPELVNEDGHIIGRDHKTGELNPSAVTKTWAEPMQFFEGWAIPKPGENVFEPFGLTVAIAEASGFFGQLPEHVQRESVSPLL